MNQSPGQHIPKASVSAAVLVLILLIGAMVGVGVLARNALLALVESYSKDFGVFIIFSGFVGVSLVAALVLFGITRSTGLFKRSIKREQFEFSGAMAGFLVTLMFLVGTYFMHVRASKESSLEIIGNIRLAEGEEDVRPLQGAKIALSHFLGFKTETDKNGNFILRPPDNQRLPQIELQIEYEGETSYHLVQRSKAHNVNITITKTGEPADGAPGHLDYQLAFKTGTRFGSGTDARIYVTLYGTKGDSGEHSLPRPSGSFEVGRTDCFSISARDLGNLERIMVRHDDTGIGAGWFLEEVRVTNVSEKTEWIFPCHKWLAKDEYDGQIERTLYRANSR